MWGFKYASGSSSMSKSPEQYCFSQKNPLQQALSTAWQAGFPVWDGSPCTWRSLRLRLVPDFGEMQTEELEQRRAVQHRVHARKGQLSSIPVRTAQQPLVLQPSRPAGQHLCATLRCLQQCAHTPAPALGDAAAVSLRQRNLRLGVSRGLCQAEGEQEER